MAVVKIDDEAPTQESRRGKGGAAIFDGLPGGRFKLCGQRMHGIAQAASSAARQRQKLGSANQPHQRLA